MPKTTKFSELRAQMSPEARAEARLGRRGRSRRIEGDRPGGDPHGEAHRTVEMIELELAASFVRAHAQKEDMELANDFDSEEYLEALDV